MAKDYFSEKKEEWRLINGDFTNREPLAYCCERFHRGYLTKNLIDSHQCLQKQCMHLHKNESHSYWEQRARAKAIKKAKKKGKITYEYDGKTYLIE